MCLVNTATQIAKSGKRVLIVDFDLEAPGIPTFNMFDSAQGKLGLVDYITLYRNTGVAPDALDYSYSVRTYENGGEILVMPAGQNDASYSSKLNAIDWVSLYTHEEGYIFFEDLKTQWKDALRPDYVLIDSRTGHSDVEGICTRQLPDAVCFLFFPNEQNLEGLKRVVKSVRRESAQRVERHAIPLSLHFVVSNVPDLDDEDGIVGDTLNRFKQELDYDELAGQIHHYDSLSLLNQEIFSERRPKSRLALEYKGVAEAIISGNLDDREVALAFLESTARDIRTPTAGAYFSIPIENVERILSRFPADHDILLQVAIIYETIGRFSDALGVLSREVGERSSYWYSIRARLHHRIGEKEQVAKDLTDMLRAPKAEVASLLEALSIAPQVHPGLLSALPNSEALRSLTDDQQIFVALQLDDGEEELPAKFAILESVQEKGTQHPDEITRHALAMAAIGMRRFERAVEILTPADSDLSSLPLPDAFNLAMAMFGKEGAPDVQLFSLITNLHEQKSLPAGANYDFCIAIAYAVVGKSDMALKFLESSRKTVLAQPQRDFSPWTYAKVSPKVFLAHLKQLEEQVPSGHIVPGFLHQKVLLI